MNLADIKGIGKLRIEKLAKAGFFTPADLLMHFPYKYLFKREQINFDCLTEGEELTFYGKVIECSPVKFIRRGLNCFKVKFVVGQREITATWFNQRFLAQKFISGQSYWINGLVKIFKKTISVSAPMLIQNIDNDKDIIPLYKNISGLPSNVLLEALNQLLNRIHIHSFLPEILAQKNDLLPLDQAVKYLHSPNDKQNLERAAQSVAIENLSCNFCAFLLLKNKNLKKRPFIYKNNKDKLKEMVASLPFKLTIDQQSAVNDIVQSLHGDLPMNRLLQGDVGCGKTVVAFLIMYYAYLSGFQSVLMAPTEILAMQHYQKAISLLEKFNVKVILLTGSQSKKEKEQNIFLISSGMADVVIGTHAVIQEGVEFAALSLVITDEQQRFGVNQRAGLENKAMGCDCLVMTATPIPRTLALTLYGDLEQSIIKETPMGKAKITTAIVTHEKMDKMFQYIVDQALKNEQTYMVCARIEESEDNETLFSVQKVYDLMAKKYPNLKLAVLHGQMKDDEKNFVMSQFSSGQINVLISTTVVEVGIDVPNATTMVIFNAERFGLSQLHQLRGRVGRGKIDSYCFILGSASAQERLHYFCKNSNGFDLAEYDFNIRGAGDFIGTRQHGFKAASFLHISHADMIKKCREIALEMLTDNELSEKIARNFEENGGEYIRNITLN